MVNRRLKGPTAAALVAALAVAACSKAGQKAGQPKETGPVTAKSADGVPIAYEVQGDGPMTLVFVHGWSCDRTYWRRQMEPLSYDYRVVALDLAGHGASGADRTAWTIPNFANDVAAVVQALDLKNVVLIGHSLGGPVVVEAGLLLPDRVTGVIGVDAFFDDWSKPGMQKVVDQLRPNFAAGTRAFVRKGLFLATSPAALADSIADSMAAAPPEIALPALDSMLAWARDRQDKAASALQAPTGLIMTVGGRRATSQFQRSRGNQPTLGVDELPGSGHFLMLEIPDAFNAQLRDMLSRIRAPGST
jgi:pimeloyl-ACP methyl ester carboxylesterase